MEFIANRQINSKNLLVINAYIENKEVIRERIFFEFYKEYDRSKAIKMALSIIDVRALVYGIKEVIKKGHTNYMKTTESNGVKKTITLTNEYINATDGNLKIGIKFASVYEFIAFADDLVFLVEYVEKNLFEKQRSNLN
jgi:hypothetical protein